MTTLRPSRIRRAGLMLAFAFVIFVAGCDTVNDESIILEQRSDESIDLTFEFDPATATEQGVMVATGELLVAAEGRETIGDEVEAFLYENGYTRDDIDNARLTHASLDFFRVDSDAIEEASLRFEDGVVVTEVASETSFDEADGGWYSLDLEGRDVTGFVQRSNFDVVLQLDMADVNQGVDTYTVDARLRFRIEVLQ